MGAEWEQVENILICIVTSIDCDVVYYPPLPLLIYSLTLNMTSMVMKMPRIILLVVYELGDEWITSFKLPLQVDFETVYKGTMNCSW